MSNIPKKIEFNKKDAKTLWMLMICYQHGLSIEEVEVAQPRLALEFYRFEQWLSSRGIYLSIEK